MTCRPGQIPGPVIGRPGPRADGLAPAFAARKGRKSRQEPILAGRQRPGPAQ